jgi:GT2 family glycosyltransferase
MLLIGVPVYGQHEYTHALVADLHREQADFVIIDNKGDYPRVGDEEVITPGHNLGWAGGSNLIFRTAFVNGYTHAMTLNNDTRISQGFIDAILDSRIPRDAGLIVPVYDDSLAQKPALLSDYVGPAREYNPRPTLRKVPFADGTSLTITRSAWQAIGELDERSFGKFAWGADVDLCLRANAAGFGIYVTEMAYINHFAKKTAKAEHRLYQARALFRFRQGMRRIWGKGWEKSCEAPSSTSLLPDLTRRGSQY